MTPVTYRSWLDSARAQLTAAGLPCAQTEAEALLGHVTGTRRSDWLLHPGTRLPPPDVSRLAALLSRRLAREPLQWLLGEVEWGGVRLNCDARALVPRPETEWLLHLALNDPALSGPALNDLVPGSSAPGRPGLRVLDVGTGTGALALGWKRARPLSHVTGLDLSAQALALAAENAALNGLNVEWRRSDLLAGVAGQTFDLILSNPPYLPDGDAPHLSAEVQRDPPLALFGGPDGLTLARRLARQAAEALAPGGVLWLELDGRNAAPFAAELAGQGWQAEVHADLTGRERFVRAVRMTG